MPFKLNQNNNRRLNDSMCLHKKCTFGSCKIKTPHSARCTPDVMKSDSKAVLCCFIQLWINAVALKSLWKRWIEVDVDEKDNRRRGKGTEGVVL